MTRIMATAVALCLTLAGGAAHAQAPDISTGIVRYRGVIEDLSSTSAVIKLRDGKTVTVDLTGANYSAVSQSSLSEIKPESFIGTESVPQQDGSARALEVTVFDPRMRGTGEGSYPWDRPNSTMTNGAVGELVGASQRVMTVRYKGGEKKVIVPDDVPVVHIEPGSYESVAVGSHVVAFTTKTPDGKLKAAFILAGQNGTVPPM